MLKNHLKVIGSLLLSIALTLTALPLTALATSSSVSGNNDETTLDSFRELFYEGKASNLRTFSLPNTVYVDDSNIIHRPQSFNKFEIDEYNEIKQSEDYTSRPNYSVTGDPLSESFTPGDERDFRVKVQVSSSNYVADKAIKAKLISQGNHSNIWLLDDYDYHYKTNTVHDSNCTLDKIQQTTCKAIADTFDGIYERMTDETTGFGKHSKQLFDVNYNILKNVGDFGKDEKVNIILYDIESDGADSQPYVAGFFWSMDMCNNINVDGISINPIDMFHMDIGNNQGFRELGGDGLNFYGTLAHEFQHMLFFMYAEVYMSMSAKSIDYLWYNEALSGLADVFYTYPPFEVMDDFMIHNSATNSYIDGDLFNFNNSGKSYGMGYLHSIMMNKKTNGGYAKSIYDYIISASGTSFTDKSKYFQDHTFDEVLGGAFKSALGNDFAGFSDKEVFDNLYYIFMEHFAADGGNIQPQDNSESPSPTIKFLSDTNDISNLWHYRPALASIPTIVSGGAVKLEGYGAFSSSLDASHEMLYKIGTPPSETPVLKIQMETIPGMQYYVVVPNASSAAGATVYPMKQSEYNFLNTNGADAYLFVSTLFNSIDTTVEFSWIASNEITGTARINNMTPRYGDTLSASLISGNSDKLKYEWFADDISQGTASSEAGIYIVRDVDIGKIVKVKITATDKAGAALASTSPVAKAINTATQPATPEAISVSYDCVTLSAINDYEYSNGGSQWQKSNIFTGLSPATTYTFYQRISATDLTEASITSPELNVTTEEFPDAQTPIISSQPSDKTVDVGDTATLAVTADVSRGALTYQWYEVSGRTNSGGTAISNATNASFNAPTSTTGTKYYYCIVTNTDGYVSGNTTATIASIVAMVTVNSSGSGSSGGGSSGGGGSGGGGSGGDSVQTPEAPSYINDSNIVSKVNEISIDTTKGSTVLSATQMNTLVTQNATKDVVIQGNNVTITFAMGTMENVDKECDFNVSYNTGANYNTIKEANGENLVLQVHFSFNGKLPAEASIRFSIGKQYAGKTLEYHYYNESTKKFEFMQDATVDEDGHVTVKQSHCSDYAFVLKQESTESKVEMAVFNDIVSHWAKNDIMYVANMGLVSGTGNGNFSPNATMTRGMVATVLGKYSNANTANFTASRFSDVSQNAYYAPYVEWAAENGIVSGVGAGKFAPNAPITREQMAVILMNFANITGITFSEMTGNDNAFTDDTKISVWAKNAVYETKKLGIIGGRPDGSFNPQGSATRAEVSVMLAKFINLVAN